MPLEFKPAIGEIIVRVTLKNPTPLSGYDVRGILISDLDPPHDIVNRDGYTTLWDNGGPVSRNPFITFGEGEPFDGDATKSEILYLRMPSPPNFQFTYAVDASWPSVAKEPYALTVYVTAGLTASGGEAEIVAYVKDWQGDVTTVTAETVFLSGTDTELIYDGATDTWRGNVSNTQSASDGEYKLWLSAKSANSGTLAIFQWTPLIVGDVDSLAAGWPLERGNRQGTGRANVNGPADGEFKWSYGLTGTAWDGSFIPSPVVDASGNTYVSLPDKLVAVNISGTELWIFPITGATSTFTPLIRDDGVIVWPVNRSLSGFETGYIYFISASGEYADIPSMLPDLVTASANLNPDGNIVIPMSDGISLCDRTGYQVWHYVAGSGNYTVPRPVAIDDDGTAYMVTDGPSPDNRIISVTKDGIEKWNIPLNGGQLCQPLLGALGKLYAASTMKDFSQLNSFGIQARYASDGGPSWPGTYSNYKGLTSFGLAEAFNGDVIATGNGPTLIYSLSGIDGSLINSFTPFGLLQSNNSAAACDASGHTYVGGEYTISDFPNSIFQALDQDFGYMWSDVVDGRGYIGSPAIGPEGYIFCVGLDTADKPHLFCFGEK